MPGDGSEVEEDGHNPMASLAEAFLLTSQHYAQLAEKQTTDSHGNIGGQHCLLDAFRTHAKSHACDEGVYSQCCTKGQQGCRSRKVIARSFLFGQHGEEYLHGHHHKQREGDGVVQLRGFETHGLAQIQATKHEGDLYDARQHAYADSAQGLQLRRSRAAPQLNHQWDAKCNDEKYVFYYFQVTYAIMVELSD